MRVLRGFAVDDVVRISDDKLAVTLLIEFEALMLLKAVADECLELAHIGTKLLAIDALRQLHVVSRNELGSRRLFAFNGRVYEPITKK